MADAMTAATLAGRTDIQGAETDQWPGLPTLNLPFQEQIEFFRRKKNVLTELPGRLGVGARLQLHGGRCQP
jgi:hypothetical protein